MGLKAELKQILRVYGEHENNLKSKIDEIKKDEKWSDEYKKLLIDNAKKSGIEGKRKLHDTAVKTINEYKQNLVNSRKPIKKDSAFELRLNNALKMVELAGKEMKPDELARVIEPFKEDFDTMQMFGHIFAAQGIKGQSLIPKNDTDSQIKALDYLTGMVDHCLNSDTDSTDKMGLSVAIEMADNLGTLENSSTGEGEE